MMLRHSRWSGRHIMPTGGGWMAKDQRGGVAACLVWTNSSQQQTVTSSSSEDVQNLTCQGRTLGLPQSPQQLHQQELLVDNLPMTSSCCARKCSSAMGYRSKDSRQSNHGSRKVTKHSPQYQQNDDDNCKTVGECLRWPSTASRPPFCAPPPTSTHANQLDNAAVSAVDGSITTYTQMLHDMASTDEPHTGTSSTILSNSRNVQTRSVTWGGDKSIGSVRTNDVISGIKQAYDRQVGSRAAQNVAATSAAPDTRPSISVMTDSQIKVTVDKNHVIGRRPIPVHTTTSESSMAMNGRDSRIAADLAIYMNRPKQDANAVQTEMLSPAGNYVHASNGFCSEEIWSAPTSVAPAATTKPSAAAADRSISSDIDKLTAELAETLDKLRKNNVIHYAEDDVIDAIHGYLKHTRTLSSSGGGRSSVPQTAPLPLSAGRPRPSTATTTGGRVPIAAALNRRSLGSTRRQRVPQTGPDGRRVQFRAGSVGPLSDLVIIRPATPQLQDTHAVAHGGRRSSLNRPANTDQTTASKTAGSTTLKGATNHQAESETTAKTGLWTSTANENPVDSMIHRTAIAQGTNGTAMYSLSTLSRHDQRPALNDAGCWQKTSGKATVEISTSGLLQPTVTKLTVTAGKPAATCTLILD